MRAVDRALLEVGLSRRYTDGGERGGEDDGDDRAEPFSGDRCCCFSADTRSRLTRASKLSDFALSADSSCAISARFFAISRTSRSTTWLRVGEPAIAP